MKALTGILTGLTGGGQKAVKPDTRALDLQREQLNDEKRREAELEAEEDARLRNIRSRSRGRNLLAFAGRDEQSETVG